MVTGLATALPLDLTEIFIVSVSDGRLRSTTFRPSWRSYIQLFATEFPSTTPPADIFGLFFFQVNALEIKNKILYQDSNLKSMTLIKGSKLSLEFVSRGWNVIFDEPTTDQCRKFSHCWCLERSHLGLNGIYSFLEAVELKIKADQRSTHICKDIFM